MLFIVNTIVITTKKPQLSDNVISLYNNLPPYALMNKYCKRNLRLHVAWLSHNTGIFSVSIPVIFIRPATGFSCSSLCSMDYHMAHYRHLVHICSMSRLLMMLPDSLKLDAQQILPFSTILKVYLDMLPSFQLLTLVLGTTENIFTDLCKKSSGRQILLSHLACSHLLMEKGR